MNNIKFITLTNTGYVNYTLNCLKSLEKIGCPVSLEIYCVGKEGHKILTDKGYNSNLIEKEDISNFQTFKNNNWANITFQKFPIIYKNLLENDYVIFTDGDIIFEFNNIIDYLKTQIGDNDLLIQNDRMLDTDHSNLCTGFMFIKSNEKTKRLFNPDNITNFENNSKWDDQAYINSVKSQLKYKLLPLVLFPNGAYYYKFHFKIRPMMIHFNWVIGDQKRAKMIKHKKWFI
jgi:hypothetical protein